MTDEIKKDIAGNEIKVGMKVAYRYYGSMYVGFVRRFTPQKVAVSRKIDDKYFSNVYPDNVAILANPEEEDWKKKAEELQTFITESLDGVLKGLKSD